MFVIGRGPKQVSPALSTPCWSQNGYLRSSAFTDDRYHTTDHLWWRRHSDCFESGVKKESRIGRNVNRTVDKKYDHRAPSGDYWKIYSQFQIFTAFRFEENPEQSVWIFSNSSRGGMEKKNHFVFATKTWWMLLIFWNQQERSGTICKSPGIENQKYLPFPQKLEQEGNFDEKPRNYITQNITEGQSIYFKFGWTTSTHVRLSMKKKECKWNFTQKEPIRIRFEISIWYQ